MQRETTAAGLRLALAVGRASDPAGLGLRTPAWTVCLMGVTPADPRAGAALKAWAAGAPLPEPEAGSGAVLYLIADPDGPGRRPASGLATDALQALADHGRLAAVGLQSTGGGALLLYARPMVSGSGAAAAAH